MKQQTPNMTTPIADFIKQYAKSEFTRFHMPGHKGTSFLGCEALDITEIHGADSLYEADGIIAESEENATKLFGSGRTLFSTEGSSQCIRAMLYLALYTREKRSAAGKRPVIAAARNVHKAFIYAATLLDFDVVWLWPEKSNLSICSCYISKEQVATTLEEYPEIEALYLTSPDYLGGQLDIQAIAEECHKKEVLLAVDNAHGAYLKFLEPSQHPIDLGADICCDSAHKTLPVLTGGAYLHISKNAPEVFAEQAKYALNLFGSTSPSYLILSSLDLCNRYLAGEYRQRLKEVIDLRNDCQTYLMKTGWRVVESDPLKITVELPNGISNSVLISKLRENHIECEYSDPNYVVFMLTPENTKEDLQKLAETLEELLEEFGHSGYFYEEKESLAIVPAKQVMSIREAMFSAPERVSLKEAENRICRVPTVSCPPAIPIAVPGELITKELMSLFEHYGVTSLDVVKNIECHNK